MESRVHDPLLRKNITGHATCSTHLSLHERLLSPRPASLVTVWCPPAATQLRPDATLLDVGPSEKRCFCAWDPLGTPGSWQIQRCGHENEAVVLKHPSKFHVQSPSGTNPVGPAGSSNCWLDQLHGGRGKAVGGAAVASGGEGQRACIPGAGWILFGADTNLYKCTERGSKLSETTSRTSSSSRI